MQQPPQYPNQPPYNQPQYPQPPYPYQPPVQPPRHGAVYWTLFILFFPVTVPYVILKAMLSGRRQPTQPQPPYPQYPAQAPHQSPRHRRRKPSLNTRLRHADRNLHRVNRFLRWMERKPGRKW